MMFTTHLILIMAALLSLVMSTTATLHQSWPLTTGSEVCKQDIVALINGLKSVPFLDDVTTLFVAGMIKSSCTAPVTMAESSGHTPSVPTAMIVDDPLPVVIEVTNSSPSKQKTASVPLTIDGPNPAEVDTSFDVCPWITALPLTISGPSATEMAPVTVEALLMTVTPIPNNTFPGRDNVFFGWESASNGNDTINPVSTFLGDDSIGDSVLEDSCIIDASQPVRVSDASIAGVVPRGRAPNSLKDRFPILYLLLWWFSIAIIGSIVGSNSPSTPFLGKSWTQTFGNVSLALDKALEKTQSLGGTRKNNQALPAEYLYLIKVPAYSAFAINFVMAFFRHYHRRDWRPFIPKGLLKCYLQRPVIVVNVLLRNTLQLDVLPRQIVEALIFQQRAAIIDEDDATTGIQCRALIVSPFSGLIRGGSLLSDSQQQQVRDQVYQRLAPVEKNEDQTISQCQALVMTRSSILPSTPGSIHRPSMTRQPLMQVIDPKIFGFMIGCAVQFGPYRDVASKIIMKHLGIDHRINEVTAERDDAREELNMELARTPNVELSLGEAGKTTFELYQTNMMETAPATTMDTAEQPSNAGETNSNSRGVILKSKMDRHNEEAARRESQTGHKAESQYSASLQQRCDDMLATLNGHLNDELGTQTESGDAEGFNGKPEEKIQALEDEKKATKASHDQATAKLANDLQEANKKADHLSEANKTLETEKKEAEQDHTQAVNQLEEKLAAATSDRDRLSEATQLLRDRYERLEAKKAKESAKLKSQLEEKESALDSMKAGKIESDKANQKMIDALKQQLQEKESALEKTTTFGFSSTVEPTNSGDFARTNIDIFEDSISSGSDPTVKLFIKPSETSPARTDGTNSTTESPTSSRSSGSSFPSWNDYWGGKASTTSDASDEWEDVSETSLSAAKRGKSKAHGDDSTVVKKGRGFRNASGPKRLLKFDRS